MDISTQFVTPVSRLVQGSVYEKVTKDQFGNPLSADKFSYYFAVAIPKKEEKHWKETGWGITIWNTALQAYRNTLPAKFAWKVVDGDSDTLSPDSKSEIPPCKREGQKGCWVLNLKSNFASKVYAKDGITELKDIKPVKLGDYVQVVVNAVVKQRTMNPSVFLNHRALFLIARGKEIVYRGFDPAKIKLESELPPDAQLEESLETVDTLGIQPRHDYLVPSSTHQMTAKAEHPYHEYVKLGYTDAMLIQSGLMVP